MLWEDFAWLALLYVLANLARGIMIAMLSPLVNLVGGSDVTLLGHGESCPETIVSTIVDIDMSHFVK